MKFTVYIHNTNDGTKIASKLREIARIVDGHPLNDGLTRFIDDGIARMDVQPVVYESCAEAERKLGMTLDWQRRNNQHLGYVFDRLHAVVEA